MGTTDVISPLVLLLPSDASSYTTGSFFYANGGTVISRTAPTKIALQPLATGRFSKANDKVLN